MFAAGYVRWPVIVVGLSISNSSRAGPTIDQPSALAATGALIGRPKLSWDAAMSSPIHARVHPARLKKPSPASAAVVGLLVLWVMLSKKLSHPRASLLPRLFTSKKSLWLPPARAIGLRT